jgi:hypothetical protein
MNQPGGFSLWGGLSFAVIYIEQNSDGHSNSDE